MKLELEEVARIVEKVSLKAGRDLAILGKNVTAHRFVELLRVANEEFFGVLKAANELEEARDAAYGYLDRMERKHLADETLHPLRRANARSCIRVFRALLAPVHESRTKTSSLLCLWHLVQGRISELTEEVHAGFVVEFIALFQGIKVCSGIYPADTEDDESAEFPALEGRAAAIARVEMLDELNGELCRRKNRYPSGLDPDVVLRRQENKARILNYFGATEADWDNAQWQFDNVVMDAGPLLKLIDLNEEERQAVEKAAANNVPFGITPYYLGLIDKDRTLGHDHAVRAQVVPPPDYVNAMVEHTDDRESYFDFMKESDTSPIDLVTRRYPGIAILKPYNTCAQICVYCQRNWEIDQAMDPSSICSKDELDNALQWFRDHPAVGDVLITGGDPMVIDDGRIEYLLNKLGEMKHVYRIRFGSRTPVVAPMRWTDNLVQLLGRFHEPGRREIAVMTHFAHSYEITPEARDAVRKIKLQGISVYNQQVFTMENSRRYETVKLRTDLRSIGVDPYYTFNMKGKRETGDYMVPIARILQERKEEARLLPGLDRTDEPVFNVPRLGKNHLRAWQDHQVIMIRPDGRRVYEMQPWEKKLEKVPTYDYTDVSIFEYMSLLSARGEDLEEYKTIWYYF